MLLLVLVPVGSYREVGEDPASRAGSAPKGLAESGDTTAAIKYMLPNWAPLHAIRRNNVMARGPPSAMIPIACVVG